MPFITKIGQTHRVQIIVLIKIAESNHRRLMSRFLLVKKNNITKQLGLYELKLIKKIE